MARMNFYRCFFLDARDRVRDSQIIEAPSDALAMSRALLALEKLVVRWSAVEVWLGTRRIGIQPQKPLGAGA